MAGSLIIDRARHRGSPRVAARYRRGRSPETDTLARASETGPCRRRRRRRRRHRRRRRRRRRCVGSGELFAVCFRRSHRRRSCRVRDLIETARRAARWPHASLAPNHARPKWRSERRGEWRGAPVLPLAGGGIILAADSPAVGRGGVSEGRDFGTCCGRCLHRALIRAVAGLSHQLRRTAVAWRHPRATRTEPPQRERALRGAPAVAAGRLAE